MQFGVGTHGYQFVENHRWIGEFGVRYTLGVDGISLFMVALTALLFPIGLLASARDRAAEGVHGVDARCSRPR